MQRFKTPSPEDFKENEFPYVVAYVHCDSGLVELLIISQMLLDSLDDDKPETTQAMLGILRKTVKKYSDE